MKRFVTLAFRFGVALGMVAALASLLAVGPSVPESRAAGTANVDLDQWASTDRAWQNGNLNGNNSRYPEGGVVPFRMALEGLSTGNHEVRINFDFTAGGHKAYDFLATWNATNGSGAICSPSGGAISSMCPSLPSPSTHAWPSDPFTTDGLSVVGAQSFAGMPRRLTIWGGTILSISAPVHLGSTSGNSSVDLRVRFRADGPAVLLAWGGHLAQSSYWNLEAGGSFDGARMVSGAPWHMRTLGLDGSGNKNQDRSIQPSAIVGELPPGGGGGTSPTFPPVIPSLDPFVPSVTPPPTASVVTPEGRPRPEVGLFAVAAAGALYVFAAAQNRSSRRRR